MNKELHERIVRELTDKGKLIEAGWVGLRVMAIPPNAPEVQVTEMRKAFFAGAQHLWASVMAMLAPDGEPTENDMRRMDLIHKELDEYVAQLKQEARKVK